MLTSIASITSKGSRSLGLEIGVREHNVVKSAERCGLKTMEDFRFYVVNRWAVACPLA